VSMLRVLSLSLVCVCLCSANRLHASFVAIPGLQSTGVDSLGVQLGNGVLDSAWKVKFYANVVQNTLPSPGDVTDNTYAIQNHQNWLSNTAPGTTGSKWISRQQFTGTGNPPAVTGGTYFYQTQFDLTGLNASTATFTFRFTSDNASQVFFNGAEIAGASRGNEQFGSFSNNFTGNSGFLSGVNTLAVRVINGIGSNVSNNQGPEGLRMEIVSSAVMIPEPASALMFLLGAPAAALFLRRRCL
jgi:hypothetical protein